MFHRKRTIQPFKKVLWYRKPKFWQFRKKRYYKNILETK